MIKKCLCQHEYQDEKYGNQMRVANRMMNGAFRCTVCGKEIVAGTDDKKK